MRRSILPLLVVAVALVVMVWPREGGRATGGRAPPEPETPVEGEAPRVEVRREADRPEPGAPSGPARVRGVVRGPNGPVWRVRVVALDPKDGRELEEAWTGPEGTYEMELEPGAVDLRAEPQDVTKLAPDVRRGVRLAGAALLTVDFAVVPGTLTRGWLDLGGATEERVRLRAVPASGGEERVAESSLHGSFEFIALEAGKYRLEVDGDDWELEAPVAFRSGEDVYATLVRVASVDLEVEDARTGDAVARFQARVHFGEDPPIWVLDGWDGHLRHRVRLPSTAQPGAAWIEVVADAYFPGWASWPGRNRVRLRPLSEANLVIRAQYDDGDPYEGTLRVKEDCYVPVRQTVAGTHVVVASPESTTVTLERPVIFDSPRTVEVRVPGEVRVVFPRGGTVILRCELGPARPWDWVRMETIHDKVDGGDLGTDLDLRGEETVFREVPPGHYRFRQPPSSEFAEGHVFTEIEVTAGSRHEIDVP